MPRYKILRAKDGNKPETFKPGQTNTNIEVDVTSNVNITGYEQIIWETGAGFKPLHETKKATNCPRTAIGYIHSLKGNKLFAVSRLDKNKHTLEIIGQGDVSGGVHRF
jgi:hypothetical protein